MTNAGPVPVTITSVAFEIEGSAETLAMFEWFTQSPQPLPIPLGAGDHWTALVETHWLKMPLVQRYGPTAARRVRPVARDPAGGRYAGDPFLPRISHSQREFSPTRHIGSRRPACPELPRVRQPRFSVQRA